MSASKLEPMESHPYGRAILIKLRNGTWIVAEYDDNNWWIGQPEPNKRYYTAFEGPYTMVGWMELPKP